MLLTYSIAKAKRALCDVAQFVADSLGCASWVHNILITVMTHIVVDKSTGHAKPHSICFVTTISKILTTENTDSDLKVHALHYANDCLYASDFPFKNFYKLAYYEKTIRKNVWETSNDTYLLSVRVQTTINHISICFSPQYQRQMKCFSSERELQKTLRDTSTRAAWYGLYNDKLANQIARLAAIVAKRRPLLFQCLNVML